MTLSIHLINSDPDVTPLLTSDILNKLLLFSPSLKKLSLKMTDYSDDRIIIHSSSSTVLSSVQYFYLDGIDIDLPSLFVIAPMLRTLDVNFYLDMIFTKISSPSFHLYQLSIKLYNIAWLKIVSLLSLFPQLTHLTLLADDVGEDIADGIAWEPLLRKIKHFHFQFLFDPRVFMQQPINLDSFRTKFWREEKKWFVTYDKGIDGFLVLYSNPLCNDDSSFGLIEPIVMTESTGSQPVSFPHCHYLYMNWSFLTNYVLIHRYTHVTKLALSEDGRALINTVPYLTQILDVTRISTCSINSSWSQKSINTLIVFLRKLPRLCVLEVSISVLKFLFIHKWPRIVYLKIEQELNNNNQILSEVETDICCHAFASVQHLDILYCNISNLSRLLNNMIMTLTTVHIRQRPRINNDPMITREWIEQNTNLRIFHYDCDENHWVTLCL
jgi:hypothetical protein